MKSEEKNELWEADEQLFNSVRDKYQSPQEQKFFEQLLEKQTWDCAVIGDMLLSENDNEEQLFIVRNEFEEYSIGKHNSDKKKVHVMNLSQALSLNLKECGFLQEDIILWEWLRKRDYKGVRYDRNYDYI